MISLTYEDRRTRLGALILDLTLAEEIEFEGEVTIFPVEDGTIISDHITQGAERLRLSGTIPTLDVGSFEADDGGAFKVVDVVEQCRRLHEAREVLEVSTGQLLYTDMGIARLRAARASGPDGGNWLSVEAELVKVRKVSLRTAEVPNEAKVSSQDGAKGRSGQTNKAAGRNAAGGQQYGPVDPGQSLLESAKQSGLTPQNLLNSPAFRL